MRGKAKFLIYSRVEGDDYAATSRNLTIVFYLAH